MQRMMGEIDLLTITGKQVFNLEGFLLCTDVYTAELYLNLFAQKI